MLRLAITKVTITESEYVAYILMDESRQAVDFQLFPLEYESLMGQIRVGRVENIVENINAAFVKIGPEQNAYLPLEGIEQAIFSRKQSEKKVLSVGDELLVQVVKDAIKTKDPVVSTKLTLAGTYCMLTTENTALAVSKKLQGEERKRAKQILLQISQEAEAKSYGMIIRTNAKEAKYEEIISDVKEVQNRFLHVADHGIHRPAYSLLWKEPTGYIRKLKSLDLTQVDKIYTEDTDIYQTIAEALPYLAEQKLLELYQDTFVSLKVLYHIDGILDNLIHKTVWLKSGANILIEQLETMTVIDVNSGKNINKNPNTLCNVNKEAAVEIARQLKLRNISGMILIDFINMKTKEQMDEVVACLKQEIKKDSVPTNYLDVTRLGLVELTRKKTDKSLKEVIKLNISNIS